jgi:ABC-type Fe3+-hydroxamate transport system substrate-binding protein
MRAPLLSRPLLAILAAIVVASCSSASSASPPASSDSASAYPIDASNIPSGRPSTNAKVTIVSPAPNAVITGGTVHVVVQVTGATVVDDTNEDIRPDQGHVHLYMDNALWYMQYSLTKDIPVNPGTYVLKAEFVANDHAPFNPRDWSDQVFFTVK